MQRVLPIPTEYRLYNPRYDSMYGQVELGWAEAGGGAAAVDACAGAVLVGQGLGLVPYHTYAATRGGVFQHKLVFKSII